MGKNLNIELKDSKIFIDGRECCEITLNDKEINVYGKPEYRFLIKLGFRGYKVYQDNILVGKGKGLILTYNYETLKPIKKSELLALDLMYGNEITILNKYNSYVGTIKFNDGNLIANFNSYYLAFGIIYLAYLFGVMKNTINMMSKEKKNLEKPIVSIRANKSYMKLSLLIFVVLFIIIIFTSYLSVILAYILALFLVMVPLLARILSANNFINFYNDYLEIYNNFSYKKLIIYYSDIKEIKNYKKGFLMYLSNPILEKKEIYIPYNPKINNKSLSDYLREKINE